MSDWYLNPDGTVAMAGNEVPFLTQAEFEACCCEVAAPCSCPAGLAGSYQVDIETVSVTVTGSCAAGWSWSGSEALASGGTLTDVALTLETAGDPNCFWKVLLTGSPLCPPFNFQGTAAKLTDNTPIGDYSNDATCGYAVSVA
jgi:hypothetical protein